MLEQINALLPANWTAVAHEGLLNLTHPQSDCPGAVVGELPYPAIFRVAVAAGLTEVAIAIGSDRIPTTNMSRTLEMMAVHKAMG